MKNLSNKSFRNFFNWNYELPIIAPKKTLLKTKTGKKRRKKTKTNNLSMAIHGHREVPMLLHIFKPMEVQPLDHHTCSMAVGVIHGALSWVHRDPCLHGPCFHGPCMEVQPPCFGGSQPWTPPWPWRPTFMAMNGRRGIFFGNFFPFRGIICILQVFYEENWQYDCNDLFNKFFICRIYLIKLKT